MRLASAATVSIGALLALIQLTPAPFNAIVIALDCGVAGAVTSQIIAHTVGKKGGKRDVPSSLSAAFDNYVVEEREQDPFAGLPQPAADECKGQLKGAHVSFKSLGNNGVQIDGVPPACMTLANVFLGENPTQPGAVPMGVYTTYIHRCPRRILVSGKADENSILGSASVAYHNLSQDQLNQLQAALDRNAQH